MTVQCVTCDRFKLRGSDLARYGFGLCPLRPAWQFQSASYPRECAHHAPAAAEQVEQRRAWLAKKHESSAT